MTSIRNLDISDMDRLACAKRAIIRFSLSKRLKIIYATEKRVESSKSRKCSFHPQNASDVSQLQLKVRPLPNHSLLSVTQKEPFRKNPFLSEHFLSSRLHGVSSLAMIGANLTN